MELNCYRLTGMSDGNTVAEIMEGLEGLEGQPPI